MKTRGRPAAEAHLAMLLGGRRGAKEEPGTTTAASASRKGHATASDARGLCYASLSHRSRPIVAAGAYELQVKRIGACASSRGPSSPFSQELARD
jgi:hypothetical protein